LVTGVRSIQKLSHGDAMDRGFFGNGGPTHAKCPLARAAFPSGRRSSDRASLKTRFLQKIIVNSGPRFERQAASSHTMLEVLFVRYAGFGRNAVSE